METSKQPRPLRPRETRNFEVLRIPLKISEALAERIHVRPTQQAAAIGLLLLLVAVYFWPVIFRGEVIAPTDLLLQFNPWSSLAPDGFSVKNHLRSDIVDASIPRSQLFREAITDGDFPLWTPLHSQGRPFASNLLGSFFHPFKALLLLPLLQGLSLFFMAKLFAAGLFMYLFLRRLGVGQAGSLLGSIAYMFSGFNVVWLMWSHTTVSSFAPLLFLQTENLLRRPTPGNVAFLSLAIALMVLGGFPAVAGYFFYAVGLYFIVRLAQIVLKDRIARKALRTVGAFCLSFALGAGLTAFLILPSLEYARFIDVGYRESLSLIGMPVDRAVQLVFPNFFGNQVFGSFHGSGNLNESSGYVGIVTLLIACFGFAVGLKWRRVAPAFFGGLTLLSFLIIYDIGPFLSLVSHLPIFDLNLNTRTLSVFGFAAAATAAFGFDELLRIRLAGWQRLAVPLGLAASAMFLAGIVAFLAHEMIGRRAFLTDF
ncbi:MAG: YfhO family protein, partial [Dehalococcoidia bacterium]